MNRQFEDRARYWQSAVFFMTGTDKVKQLGYWKEQTVKYRARFLGKALLVVAGIAVLGGIVMALWNAVVPFVFPGTRLVDYPHALGLLILSRILFGGFRGRGGWHEGRRWRRWEGMTPLERTQFKQTAESRGGQVTENDT